MIYFYITFPINMQTSILKGITNCKAQQSSPPHHSYTISQLKHPVLHFDQHRQPNQPTPIPNSPKMAPQMHMPTKNMSMPCQTMTGHIVHRWSPKPNTNTYINLPPNTQFNSSNSHTATTYSLNKPSCPTTPNTTH